MREKAQPHDPLGHYQKREPFQKSLWSKIGVDHMFDHIWKTSEFPSAERKTEYPGVAQLVAHVIWEREAGVRAALS